MPEQDPIRRALQRYFNRTQQSMSTDPVTRAIAADPSVAEAQRVYDYDSPGLKDLGVGLTGAAGIYKTGAAGLPAIVRQIAGAASVLGRPEDSIALAAINPADKRRWIPLAKTAIESGHENAINILTKIQEHAFGDVELDDLYALTGKYMESGKTPKSKIIESELADIAAARGGEDITAKAVQKDLFAPRETDEGMIAGRELADPNMQRGSGVLSNVYEPTATEVPSVETAPKNMLVNPEKVISLWAEHRRGLPLRGGRPPAVALTQAGVARQFGMSPKQLQRIADLPAAEAIYLDTDSMLRKLRRFSQKNLSSKDFSSATAAMPEPERRAAWEIVYGTRGPQDIAAKEGVSKERLTELMNEIIKQSGTLSREPRPGPNKRKILDLNTIEKIRQRVAAREFKKKI